MWLVINWSNIKRWTSDSAFDNPKKFDVDLGKHLESIEGVVLQVELSNHDPYFIKTTIKPPLDHDDK